MADDTELAWAAGFFDGEGSVSVGVTKGKRGRPEGYKKLCMSVGQVAREPLDRFAAAVGEGRVTGPYSTRRRPIYRWQTGSTDGAQKVISLLLPYLSEFKREKIVAALDDLAKDLEQNPRDYYARLRQRIQKLSASGLTPAQVAVHVGLARRTVYYHLHKVAGGDA